MRLACSVFSAAVEREAGTGLVLMNAVVVKVAPQVACGAAGLETTAVRLSLAADERPAAGWGGDETAKVLEKLEGVLIFSV